LTIRLVSHCLTLLTLCHCVGQQAVAGFPVVVSGVQLLSISTRLHHNLSRLAVSCLHYTMLQKDPLAAVFTI